jgi:hypothetical protein
MNQAIFLAHSSPVFLKIKLLTNQLVNGLLEYGIRFAFTCITGVSELKGFSSEYLPESGLTGLNKYWRRLVTRFKCGYLGAVQTMGGDDPIAGYRFALVVIVVSGILQIVLSYFKAGAINSFFLISVVLNESALFSNCLPP